MAITENKDKNKLIEFIKTEPILAEVAMGLINEINGETHKYPSKAPEQPIEAELVNPQEKQKLDPENTL